MGNYFIDRIITLIKIVRHKNPKPVSDYGDILSPFKNWNTTSTGAGFFSKPDSSFYGEKKFLPLNAISRRVWEPLEVLNIKFENFKKDVSYECPYTKYIHYHAIPLYLFSDRVDEIIDETNLIIWKDMFKDHEWQVDCHFGSKTVFQITPIQSSFMGPGYESGILPSDGDGSEEDAIVALSNGEYLGFKVFVWYNK
jgi:hypothetical protein